MPPTIGAAMGFITSDPIRDSHKIGARLNITTATVISLGRRRCTAPSIAAASMSWWLSEVLEDQPPGHRVKCRENQYRSLDGRAEEQVEQNENGREHDGKNDGQAPAHTQLKFVFA